MMDRINPLLGARRAIPVAGYQTGQAGVTPWARPRKPPSHGFALDWAVVLVLPALVTALMWTLSVQQISLEQGACAWALLCFPCASYLAWKRQRRLEAPLFALVSAVYWLYYGVALFFGDRFSIAIGSGRRILPDETITTAMLMAVVGVGCLWLGTRWPASLLWLPRRVLDLPPEPARWNYARGLLALGLVFGLFEGAAFLLGEGGRQLIVVLQTTVPLVAFLLLFRQFLRGQATRLDKVLLVAFLLSKFAGGISGGWLGTAVLVAVGCGIVYLGENRRPPWLAVLPLVAYMFFFQAGKAEFRSESWRGTAEQSGIVERVARWSELSLKAWSEALDDSSGERRAQLLRDVVMRVSLLTQTALVVESTPERVPYAMGGTYSYLIATWVPRSLWPDKPSVSEANRFYQVAYDLTQEDDLETVSIAVGAMTEGYVNFGWAGVVGVMSGLGVMFSWVQRVFLARDSGLLFNAIGIVVVLSLIGIEAQMAGYVSGLVQQTMLVLLVFFPIAHFRKLRRPGRPGRSGALPHRKRPAAAAAANLAPPRGWSA